MSFNILYYGYLVYNTYTRVIGYSPAAHGLHNIVPDDSDGLIDDNVDNVNCRNTADYNILMMYILQHFNGVQAYNVL